MEKLYLSYEGDNPHVEKNEDGSLDTLTCFNPFEFESKKELFKFLIEERLKDDGQIFRFINEIISELAGVVTREVVDNSEDYPETNGDDWFVGADIYSMVLKSAKDLRVGHISDIKKDKKEFELEEKL